MRQHNKYIYIYIFIVKQAHTIQLIYTNNAIRKNKYFFNLILWI